VFVSSFFIVVLSWATFAVSHLTKTSFTDIVLPGFLSFMYARCVMYSSRRFWHCGGVRSFWSRLPDQNRFRSRFVHRNVAPSVVVVIMLSILASCRYLTLVSGCKEKRNVSADNMSMIRYDLDRFLLNFFSRDG